MRIVTRTRLVGPVLAVWNDAGGAVSVEPQVDGRTRLYADDAGDFPPADYSLRKLVVAMAQDRQVIDEVRDECVVNVVVRRAEIILPACVRVTYVTQVAGGVAVAAGVVGVSVGVDHLVRQIIREGIAPERSLHAL